MATEFFVGDIVRMTCSGPAMTVTRVTPAGIVTVRWFDQRDKMRIEIIPAGALIHAVLDDDWIIAQWQQQYSDLQARYEELLHSHNAAVDEFNRGFEAFERGELLENEPAGTTQDMWQPGWLWAQHCDARRNAMERDA